jgi:hypothetical protein
MDGFCGPCAQLTFLLDSIHDSQQKLGAGTTVEGITLSSEQVKRCVVELLHVHVSALNMSCMRVKLTRP